MARTLVGLVLSRRARPGCGTYGGTPPVRHRPGRRSGGAAARRSRSRPGWPPSRREVGALQQRAGVVQALREQPLAGRGAGLGREAAGEGALRHGRPLGEHAHRLVLGEVLAHPGQQRGQAVRACSRAPAGRCTGAGRRRAGAAPPSGGRSGWRPTAPSSQRTWCRQASMPAAVPALVITRSSSTKSTSGSIRRLGEAPLELVGVPPVGGAGAAVEQPGLAEQERAGADREHPGAAGVGPAEDVEDAPRTAGPGVVVGRGDHEVGVVGSLQPVRRGDGDRRCPSPSAHRGVSEQARKSIAGTPSSVRSTPKTSCTTPSSKKPGRCGTTTAARGQSHAGQYGRNCAEDCQSCHWWQEHAESKLTAMTIFAALILVAMIAGIAAAPGAQQPASARACPDLTVRSDAPTSRATAGPRAPQPTVEDVSAQDSRRTTEFSPRADRESQSSSGSSRRASQVASRSTGVSNSGCTSTNSWSRSASQARVTSSSPRLVCELLDPAVGEVHGRLR